MSKALKDFLVVSDMDNTLLTAKAGVPACNKATIELFCSLGGRFTVATGRPPESVRAALKGTKLSCPAICCGGSVLYDFETDCALEKHVLPFYAARSAVKAVLEKFPDVGAEIMVEEGRVCLVASNRFTHAHLKDEEIGCIMCPLDEVPQNWAKVMFAADPITLARVEAYCKTLAYEGLYFVATNTIYYEIMPAGVSKAQALRELCKQQRIPLEHTIVIGDYYNDLDILKIAGHAVVVANAPPEIKLVANQIVSSCVDGGVGEYLYGLIKQYT